MKYETEEQIRKDFARIFNWYERETGYGYARSEKIRTPEWAEIFSKIGSLIEASKVENIEYKVVVPDLLDNKE